MSKSVAILTGGGDAPGLNAVIRAVVKYGAGRLGWRIVGVEDSFNGLLERPFRVRELTPISCKGILGRGGTILGTTNHGDPFAFPDGRGHDADRSRELRDALVEVGVEGVIVVGGDGTMRISRKLMEVHGIKVVGVPKTIDNDLGATDVTFGFQSAVDCATDALDRLHTTAESHDRVLVLEVMGRDAGWIALHAGVSGGADCIVLPEIPWRAERLAAKLEERQAKGSAFSLIVVAEGAKPLGEPPGGKIVPGRAAQAVADAIAKVLPKVETRITVLGHLQRGGSPVAYDRMLATRFGVGAVDLVAQGRWGELVRIKDGVVDGVPLLAADVNRTVDPDGDLVRVARAVGVEFGG
ncbi:MAG: 6-phosphofructokinase [Myxococcota bacterium]